MTYVLLLLVNMSDLEPDVGMGKRTWRVAENAVETSQRVVVLALLLVNDAETEQDFVGFIKV
jgi:hypothetical protein